MIQGVYMWLNNVQIFYSNRSTFVTPKQWYERVREHNEKSCIKCYNIDTTFP